MSSNSFIKNATFNSVSDSGTYKNWTEQDMKVCYTAKGRQSFGTFTLKESGLLKGIMLEHLSGYVTCSTEDDYSKGLWGC